MSAKKGVLLMAYGSPDSINEVEEYYTDIRRGRKPSPELLLELQERYAAIGGKSPLTQITRNKAESLKHNLGEEYKVFIGMRHWKPWINDAIKEMRNDGISHAIAITMAPHYSNMSIEQYINKVDEAKELNDADIDFKFVRSWHDQPLFISAVTEKIQDAFEKLSSRQKLKVIFSAHSLPEKILANNDPYVNQLKESSRLVAENAGITDWDFAFQSAGRTEDKWLGPNLEEVIEEYARERYQRFLVCPIGFIDDHLEVLYDIDIELQSLCRNLNVELVRTESLNDHPKLIQLFAQLTEELI